MVVVSPLLALMQDQHEKMAEHDVDVVKLDSTLTARETRELRRGECGHCDNCRERAAGHFDVPPPARSTVPA